MRKHPCGLHAALVKRVIKCESLLLLFPHIVFPSCTSTSGITGCGGICFCCPFCTGPCTHSGGTQLGQDLCPFHINHPPCHGSSFCLTPCFFLAPSLYCNLLRGCEIGGVFFHNFLTSCASVIVCLVEFCSSCFFVLPFPSCLVVSYMLSRFHFAFLLYLIKPICFPQLDLNCTHHHHHHHYSF